MGYNPGMSIIHDKARGRFVLPLAAEGDEAVLRYDREEGVLDLYHVFVPPQHRSRGHAGRLVIAAFDYAREQGLKVRPTCPFISGDFLPRFPQYQDLVER